MITLAKDHPRVLCLLLLLSASACDHVLSGLAGPEGLRGATPTMHDDKDDGADDTSDDPTLPKIICCDCNGRTCTQPATPEPPTEG